MNHQSVKPRPNLSTMLIVAVLPILPGCDYSKPPEEQAIHLHSRAIKIPDERVSDAFLEAVRASSENQLHAFVALTAQLNVKEKRALEGAGLFPLYPVTKTVWAATVTADFLERPESENSKVRWIGAIEAGDKIEPD